MTSDLCNDEVVVCVVTAPQIITTQSVVCSSGAGGGSRLATSSATVELGRRLLLAARAGDTTQVLDLMAKGAPFTTDWLGTSPLHLAAGNGYADTCGVLLRAGFSCEARTKVQRTPLHGAAQGGHLAAARTLLAAGAAPDARDMLRMTPLHWAAQRGHAPVVAELLAHGGDPSVRSKFQKSPRDLALAIGRADIVRMLDDAQQKRRLSDDGATIEEAIMEISNEPQFETVQKIQEIKQTKPKTEIKLQANLEELQSSAVKRDDLIKIIENAMKDRGTVLKSSDNIIDQMDVSTTESQVHFETVTKIQDEKPTKANPTLEGIDLGCSGGEGPEAAGAALLRQHGITLLPADDGSTVLTALQSGRTVVLSDAGKLMLKESSSGGSGSSGGSSGSGSSSSGSSTAAPAPLRPPPRGVKLFTLNNKLLTVPRPPDPTSQVKFVQLPPDVKIVSPSKLSAMKAKARPSPTRPSPNRPSVKIIMNKSNFNKLIANGAAKTSLTHNGVELVPEMASGPGSGSPRQLRAQLQAAQRTIAELRAELHTCRERLAQYENL